MFMGFLKESQITFVDNLLKLNQRGLIYLNHSLIFCNNLYKNVAVWPRCKIASLYKDMYKALVNKF